jgi:hypothetical protein
MTAKISFYTMNPRYILPSWSELVSLKMDFLHGRIRHNRVARMTQELSRMLDMDDEQRVWQRYPYTGKLRILDATTREPRATAWGTDLSGSGIGFFSPVDLALRDFVIVEFELNGSLMKLPACIMHHSGTRYGAEFLQIPQPTRLLIDQSLSRSSAPISSRR